jgi:hypothetical protein
MSVRVSPRSGSTASSVPRCRHLPETLPADGPLAGRGFSPLPGRASPAAALARNGPPIRTAIAAGFWRWERGGHGIDLAVVSAEGPSGRCRSGFGRSRLLGVISARSARPPFSCSTTMIRLPAQYAPADGFLAHGIGPGHRGPRRHHQTRHLDDARSEAVIALIYATLAVAQELAGDNRTAPGPNAQGAADVVMD